MIFTSMRASIWLLLLAALALGGCTRLLGEFSYDPNGPTTGTGKTPAQGDIVVLPVNGLVTSEQGGKATFTVVLAREPKSDVFIGLSSSNPSEGTVSPTTLSFSTVNWNAPQMVQVTGVDDDKEDGPQKYTITTTAATSEDASFFGKDPLDPEVTNSDDDTAGFTLMPPNGLVTSESGAEATFTVRLNHVPTADVTVPLSTDRPSEGTVSPASLTFTVLNWMAPQTVTVTGVNDDVKDGPQRYNVVTGNATSDDAKYAGLDVPDEEVTNNDNDTAGIVLSPMTGLLTFEPSLMTSLTVALSSPPTGDVTIGLTSSDESEGVVSPSSLVFTPLNWMAPQVVSVTAVDDTRADGDQPFQVLTTILASDDADYLTLSPLPKADVINVDDDTPNIAVLPMELLVTDEDLKATMFTVVLMTKPQGLVKLDVASNRPEEGVATPPLLTFTEENWNAPQTVTVMGVDDEVADGNQSYVVRVKPNPETADAQYLTLLERDVMVQNNDNDSAGVVVEPLKGLQTREDGGSDTFTIHLTSKPRAEVSIALSSSDRTEGTVMPASVTFTPDNYKSAQTVTVRGVNDDVADGHQPYRIVTEAPVSGDPDYAKLDVPNVEVTNLDDDSPGITVEPRNTTLTTNENGQTATFTVRLNSQPTADVNLTLTSNKLSEGVASPGALKFTPFNWRAPQTVMVKGQQDDVHDGPQPYRIVFGPVVSDDKAYGGDPNRLRPLDIQCSNVDDDSASIRLILPQTPLTTSEKSGSPPATFQVALNSQPKANVSIGISSSRPGEGTVAPGTLTFTPINWSSPQTVTITGVDEKIQDGPQSFFVVFARSTSNDTDYQNILPNPANVTVTNQDDDSAGILVKATSPLATGEPNLSATFTVELTSQPTADVVIPLASNNPSEGTVSPASLTFTAANWSAPRTVTLTGVDDKVVDGDQQYAISVGPSTSADAKYNPKTAADVKVTNKDDDTARILVSAISGPTSESTSSASFTINLQTQPRGDVTVPISSSRPKEGTVNPSNVTFTPVNWASPQKITVTGVNDDMQDGDQPYTIDVGAASSALDANYNMMDPPDVAVVNLDNDTAGIVVSQLSTQTSESGVSASFSVALRTQPSGGATVTLSLASSNPDEGVLSDSSLTFTDADWRSAKVVTVTGVDDDDTADGAQPFTVSFGAPKSADSNYSKLLAPNPLSFTNLDNDSPGIIVSAKTGQTSEDLETMSFTVVLLSKPKGDVKIPVMSSDITEGTVSTGLLTFTTANWNGKQTVTVTGVNDDEDDGSASYSVILGRPTSTDSDYAEIDPGDVALTNVDNDSAGILVTQPAGDTTEAGGTTTFSIRLRTKPKGNVTIPLKSGDLTEGSLTQGVTEVVLTPSNWGTPQVITVHGEDDMEADGEQSYSIETGESKSTDANYDKLTVDDVLVKNQDNDTAGYSVKTSGNTNEGGGTATFKVALTSKPTAAVSIPVASNNTAEGKVSITSLDFTTGNWQTEQTVTVTGVDDDVVDGGIEYKIVLSKPTSADANYASKDPPDVTLINADDDSAAFNLTVPALTTTSETAGAPTVTIQVVLASKPKANVKLAIVSSNEMEGVPSKGVLTFTPGNWSEQQAVIITGVDDTEMDGTKEYSITVGPPETTDMGYAVLPAQTVDLENEDDD